MDSLKNGWFSELSPLWPGQCISLEVEEVLHQEKSEFQDILVLKSKTYGKVLVLDGVIQCTELDEFSYQEMISFLPITCHPNPQKVLIVGGGDGGVARELVKHPLVQSVVQCEIDERVVEVSKKFLPFMAKGFEDSKVTLHIGDGFEFIKNHPAEFDVIITDSSDPIGPAASLFQESYFQLLCQALKPGGIVCSQGENAWFHSHLIAPLLKSCTELFPVVDYAYTCIPTYPGGQIGFILCSTNPETQFRTPIHQLSEAECEKMQLRYYSSEMHSAAFVVPRFARKALISLPKANEKETH
ncbi:spermidine synthase-like [Daphnia pulex]|uniref:PABS domain-containing protein n=1 Tax=Daphnia pulex TaxID=6669 RepID=E9GMY9_DAPPU|nr:spermidine synthase-like [Daphnia pulex]XP_046645270.1 spermidine synthase-like [Daphnia pulicaria]EFX79208.1 hypothetical protein DAPPUDRAFT_304917 [Daphnia pulex]|eukprot:EFX79208.1 hypothetical protein DAPPUDRAFT_304917 [Daphnia pulex]